MQTSSTFNLRIRGREFVAQGPTPRFGTYVLTGPRGASFLAVPAYTGDAHTFKVLGGRSFCTELRIAGNLVRLTDATGELREAGR